MHFPELFLVFVHATRMASRDVTFLRVSFAGIRIGSIMTGLRLPVVNQLSKGYHSFHTDFPDFPETPDNNLSIGMRQLNGAYTQLFDDFK
jgi:hypothetical protein